MDEVLKAVDASLQKQDAYEDQVIQEVTHQKLAPHFTGQGWPDLSGLGSDVGAARGLLSKIRQEEPRTELSALKEHMLRHYLRTMGGLAKEDLPPPRPLVRRQAMVDEPDTKPAPILLRKRVPIMKRRRSKERPEDDEETMERKEQLKRLRQERQQRKVERRKALFGDDANSSSSEDEAEFGEEPRKPMAKKPTLLTATCPECQSTISAPNNIDEALSRHMASCQPGRRRRRSTRNDNEESIDQPEPLMPDKKRRPVAYRPQASVDDLDEYVYEDRVDDWIENGLSRMKEMKERDVDDELPGEEVYEGGLCVPAWINDRLFAYQRVGLRWMWDLNQQEAGGIVGDEMGLGKTVQVSSFLGCMASSRKLKSVLVVAPATMLQHWLSELAVWAPGLRRVLIHPSGESDGASRNITAGLLSSLSKWLKKARRDRINEAIDREDRDALDPHSFCGTGYVVVTTYENLRRNDDIHCGHRWSYVVLDEAQKIRNPDADITIVCKRLRTPNRLALSGTPIQNDLKELWSLVDFVFPGRLGTLPAFDQEFATVIKRGGYSNASPMQVQLAYRCSLVLRDLINPFLLRRQKKEVKEVARMPGKTEHVLFCRMSGQQRTMYEAYLRSDDVSKAIRGSNQLLAAITVLRKICNHPDLVCDPDKGSVDAFISGGYNKPIQVDDDLEDSDDEDLDETITERSGKLEVLSKILPLWREQGHRVLIFCQWKKMLNIIHRFTMFQGWKFGRLDGNTNVASRQRLVDAFNTDDSYFGMLCTTRTGGVGLNLTGANRIILYDPDWNPQTDAQARERAWRFGQTKEVTVYRLITAGTVEEKIYQRQIFKTALSNKILQDPRQRRLFSQRDLRDLFTLKADSGSLRSGAEGMTDTSMATKGVGVIDPLTKGDDDDNDTTLKDVMKSKGLAGIFDHNFVDPDSSKLKTGTAKEMEDKAKQVARAAMSALQASTEAERPKAFGSSASGSLLASIRQRESSIETGTHLSPTDTQKYAQLLERIQTFVRKKRPTTNDLMTEFSEVDDVVVFKRLLRSVAELDKGIWRSK